MTEDTDDKTLHIGRRGFMKGAAVGGLAMATMPISEAVWADTGKTLNVRSSADIDELDPGFYQNGYNVDVMNCIYSKLVHYTPGDKWGHELQAAEKIEQTDATHIEFTLKKGIMFTGGYGEMTAEDVKFSFERILKHDSPIKGDWGPLDHVEVTGKYTGTIVLKKPFVPLWNITLPYGGGMIVSKKAVMEATKDGGDFKMKPPAFSGPYVLDEWKPGQHIRLTRNPEWTGPKPGYDEILIRPIQDSNTAETAYEAGNLDYTRISLSSLKRFQANPPANTSVQNFPSLYYVWLGMNQDNPALKDINLRKAIQYAINIPQILNAAYSGEAKPSTGLIAPGLVGHRKESLIPLQGDLEKAKAFLEKAGGPPKTTLTIDTLNASKWTAIAQVIQAQLKQIGINVQVNVQDSGAFWTLGMESKGDRWKKVQLIVNRFSMLPDPYYATEWFTSAQVGVWNWERFSNKEFDKLNEEAISELDHDKRAAMYRKMQDLMEESGDYRFITHEGNPVMYRKTMTPALRPDARPLFRYFKPV